jgi:hypothetical protein
VSGRPSGRIIAEERALMDGILAAEAFLCWDCRTAAFGIEWDPYNERHMVALDHLRECPVLRTPWSARAADDYIRAVLIMGGMTLAEYCDVSGLHRVSR